MVQWLLEKGAEVAAKATVRGDPTGQGDPEGWGRASGGSTPAPARNCFPPKPWPLGGYPTGGQQWSRLGGGSNSQGPTHEDWKGIP